MPANDNFANAFALNPAGDTVAGTTVGASSEVDEPIWNGLTQSLLRNDGSFTFQSVWYKLTAVSDGAWRLVQGATAAGLDTTIYRGTSLADLTPIAIGANSDISFVVFAGQTVFIQYYSYVGGTPPGESIAGPQAFTLSIATSPLLRVDVKVAGTHYGEFLYGGSFNGFPISADHIRDLWFGSFFSGGVTDRQIRNIKVGTTGYGSSDLFAPTLADLSEFDSVQGSTGDLTASGGVLSVANSGADVYAVKDLGADITAPLYVQLDLKVAAAEIAAGFVPDFHGIATGPGEGSWIDSIYSTTDGGWKWFMEFGADASALSTFGAGAVADTWVTFDFRWDFSAGAPLPADTFSLAMSAGAITLAQGASGTLNVNATLTAGASQSVALSVLSGLPLGVTASFTPSPIASAGGTSTLLLTVASYVAAGTHSIVVQGVGPSDTETTSFDLIVTGISVSNVDCTHAISLDALGCPGGSLIINNSAAGDTAPADDPLNTVSALSWTFQRQMWVKFRNASASRAYVQFTLNNPTGAAYSLAAALYLGSCDALSAPSNYLIANGDSDVFWPASISAGADASSTMGVVLEPGQTVWMELAGDDGEGSPVGWDGQLKITWLLRLTTFRDTPDDGYLGTASLLGPFSSTGATALSFCKRGSDSFLAMNNGGSLEVWKYTASVRTVYSIGTFGTGAGTVQGGSDIGDEAVKLRSDGTDVWLAIVTNDTVSNPWGAGTWTAVHRVTVSHFTGSSFAVLGHDDAKCNNPGGSGLGNMTAAACEAEAGVLHVMWSERGGTSAGQVGQRISYSKWSTSARTSQSDIAFNQAATGSFADADCLLSQYLFVTNSSGSALAFYGRPTGQISLGSSPPYGTQIEMWDVSAGTANLLQTIDGTTLDGAITSLDSAHTEVTLGGTRFSTSLGGVGQVIYLSVPWVIGGASRRLLIRMPADGSAYDYPDGVSVIGTDAPVITDIFDDGATIWACRNQYQISDSAVSFYDRDCPGWHDAQAAPVATIASNGIEMEKIGETIFTIGSFNTGGGGFIYAPLSLPVLRDLLICDLGSGASCAVGPGLHIARLF